MLLFDDVTAAAGTPNDAATLGCLGSVAKSLTGAARFVLTDTFVRAAHNVSQNKPSSILAGRSFWKLPFRRVWFEWQPASVGPLTGKDDADDVRPMPARIGYLLECLTDTLDTGYLTLIWRHNFEPAPFVCPIGFFFDWSPLELVKRVHIAHGIDIRSQVENLSPALRKSRHLQTSGESEAFAAICNSGGVASSIHALELHRKLVQSSGGERLMHSLYKDVEGEYIFVLAVLMLLNTKNCVEITAERTSPRLHLSRGKSGRRPLAEYSTVKIVLNESRKKTLATHERRGVAARFHLVRGHFKIRKTGIYWWSPFTRGDLSAGVVGRAGYTLARAPEATQ